MSKSKSIKNPFDLIIMNPSGLFIEFIDLLTGLFIVFFIVWFFIRIHEYFSNNTIITKSNESKNSKNSKNSEIVK